MRGGQESSQAATSAAYELEGRIFAGRFRTGRALKNGQGIVTMLADDLGSGAQVVVKVAKTGGLSPGVHMRLEHEAPVLRDLRAPEHASLP